MILNIDSQIDVRLFYSWYSFTWEKRDKIKMFFSMVPRQHCNIIFKENYTELFLKSSKYVYDK